MTTSIKDAAKAMIAEAAAMAEALSKTTGPADPDDAEGSGDDPDAVLEDDESDDTPRIGLNGGPTGLNEEPALLPAKFFRDGQFKSAYADKAEEVIAEEMKSRIVVVDIAGETRFLRRGRAGKPFQPVSKTSLEIRFAPQRITYFSQKTSRTIDPVKVFIASPKPHYDGLQFEPDPAKAAENPELFNTWTGLPVQGIKGDWSLLQAHIRDNIVADNGGSPEQNEFLYNWLLMWAAHMFQFPGDKKATSIVLVGEQRIGKSVFVDFLRAALKHLAVKVSRGEQLTGKFNFHLAGRLLIVSEEAAWAGDPTAKGVLKDLVSSDEMQVEMKGVNAFTQSNHARYAFLSNERWVVPIDENGDGFRFGCFRASSARKNDFEYFGKIKAQMKAGGLEAMVHDLMTFVPEDHGLKWDMLWEAPDTLERRKQASQSLTGPAAALLDIIRTGEFHGKLATGEPFHYVLSETEPTDVVTTHLSIAIAPAKIKHGGDPVAAASAVRMILGEGAYLKSPRTFHYRSSLASTENDAVASGARLFRFPPLAELRAKVEKTWA